jgi:hypothetical protein
VAPVNPPLASRRYAEDQSPEDWTVEDAGEGAESDLNWLRQDAEDGQEEHFGDMEDHVDEIQEHVQDAREHGVDASPLVASRGVKRAGKARQRPAVVPEVVRVYGGNGQGGTTVQHLPDLPDPYARTAASYDDEPVGGDIVAQFQRSAAAADLMGGGSGGGSDDFDIAGAAAAHLKTAGRNFSLAEQHELMHESGRAGNLASLDLEGTHYEAENSVGLW